MRRLYMIYAIDIDPLPPLLSTENPCIVEALCVSVSQVFHYVQNLLQRTITVAVY